MIMELVYATAAIVTLVGAATAAWRWVPRFRHWFSAWRGHNRLFQRGRCGSSRDLTVGSWCRLILSAAKTHGRCKGYRGSVGASAVRDFRGAMTGRGDKGLLITTGTFTAEAKAEATRTGAPPIDLIDGYQLCELLKKYNLGVHATTRVVEDIEVDEAFFLEL
jgi:hypothetical protein